jgi:hypothetical protein
MLAFFQNHHIFGISIAVMTAILVYAYQYTIDPVRENNKRTFYKTLAAGVISALVLSWVIYRPEQLSTEPFNAEPALPGATATPV